MSREQHLATARGVVARGRGIVCISLLSNAVIAMAAMLVVSELDLEDDLSISVHDRREALTTCGGFATSRVCLTASFMTGSKSAASLPARSAAFA